MKRIVLVLITAATLAGCTVDDSECYISYELTMMFEGFDEHVGQLFELRTIRSGTFDRVLLAEIPAPEFTVTLDAYCGVNKIDFYADFNGNGEYDPPPTDHAWHIFLDYVATDPLIVEHNTNFVDIEWPY